MAGVRMAILAAVCTCLSVSAVNGSAKLAIRGIERVGKFVFIDLGNNVERGHA